ncbi:hypothetical protein ASZ78_017110 [Callipepla squamata]|uniref:Uncharacterized protein n=1 Tax=Callipepla squamata TaxID=9009 RepID=A0A226NDG9_CALSU|nr:hypothetical protein ASZ78_017110 [Callipepla squamata]
MGSREPCRRLEEVLGALYDLGGKMFCSQTKTVAGKKNVSKQEFNFEKARLEVHRFGITGYEKQEQRIWERERAVMLGAKSEINCSFCLPTAFKPVDIFESVSKFQQRYHSLSLLQPPKKEHINYKTYQEKMKVKKTTKDDDKGQEHKSESQKKKKDLKARFTGALRGLWDDIHPSAEGSALLFNKDWPVLQEQMHLMKGSSVLTQVPGKQYG